MRVEIGNIITDLSSLRTVFPVIGEFIRQAWYMFLVAGDDIELSLNWISQRGQEVCSCDSIWLDETHLLEVVDSFATRAIEYLTAFVENNNFIKLLFISQLA